MLYVSSHNSRGQYGVTDTDDGKTEFVFYPQLFEYVEKVGLTIHGVDVRTGDVTKMKWPAKDKRFVPDFANRLEFLKWTIGYDYIVEQHEGGDFTQFVVSIGGDVLTYRVYGSNGDYRVYEK